jgi:hypothetical protein
MTTVFRCSPLFSVALACYNEFRRWSLGYPDPPTFFRPHCDSTETSHNQLRTTKGKLRRVSPLLLSRCPLASTCNATVRMAHGWGWATANKDGREGGGDTRFKRVDRNLVERNLGCSGPMHFEVSPLSQALKKINHQRLAPARKPRRTHGSDDYDQTAPRRRGWIHHHQTRGGCHLLFAPGSLRCQKSWCHRTPI